MKARRVDKEFESGSTRRSPPHRTRPPNPVCMFFRLHRPEYRIRNSSLPRSFLDDGVGHENIGWICAKRNFILIYVYLRISRLS